MIQRLPSRAGVPLEARADSEVMAAACLWLRNQCDAHLVWTPAPEHLLNTAAKENRVLKADLEHEFYAMCEALAIRDMRPLAKDEIDVLKKLYWWDREPFRTLLADRRRSQSLLGRAGELLCTAASAICLTAEAEAYAKACRGCQDDLRQLRATRSTRAAGPRRWLHETAQRLQRDARNQGIDAPGRSLQARR